MALLPVSVCTLPRRFVVNTPMFFTRLLQGYHAQPCDEVGMQLIAREQVRVLPTLLRNEEVVRLAARLVGRTVAPLPVIDRIAYRISGAVTFRTPDGDCYRITTGADTDSDSVDRVLLLGTTVDRLLDQGVIFLGCPRFHVPVPAAPGQLPLRTEWRSICCTGCGCWCRTRLAPSASCSAPTCSSREPLMASRSISSRCRRCRVAS
jgi:hypothetical protein